MPLTYTRELTDDEVKLLEHYIEDAGQWIDAAITQKIMACRNRIFMEAVNESMARNERLPETSAAVIKMTFEGPNYKNRKQRVADAEGKKGHGKPT